MFGMIVGCLQNGEFVATEAGYRVDLADTASKTVGSRDQQFVADWMTKRVIHALETVKIETHDREPLSPLYMRIHLQHTFPKKGAVR